MQIIADIVMAAWIPVVLLVFGLFPPRRAVIVAYLCGWLFLPFQSYSLPLFPDFTKMSATSIGVVLGALVFDFQRLSSFRFHWFDLPIAVYCIAPLFSSVSNGLGVYDGVSGVSNQILTWGIPYVIGRLYFSDSVGIRELAIAIFVGGLIYIPLCLFEIRMSPQLHSLIYGIGHRGSGSTSIRLGGYRPSVFLDSGLQLGMWMTACTLIGFWLWRAKAVKLLWGVPLTWLVPFLVAVTVLCRSTGALALLFMGMAALVFSQAVKTRLALWCLLLIAPIYLMTRVAGVWDGAEATALAKMFDEERAGSLQFRFDSEDLLVDRALKRPIFGWGSWGRNRVFDDQRRDLATTDGRWILDFGKHGLVSLVSLYLAMLLPLTLLLVHTSQRRLLSADLAPVLSLSIVCVLCAIDFLPNAMINPIVSLAMGAVTGHAALRGRSRANTGESVFPNIRTTEESQNIPTTRRRLNSGRL